MKFRREMDAKTKAMGKQYLTDLLFGFVVALIATVAIAHWWLPNANPWVWFWVGVVLFVLCSAGAVQGRATLNQAYPPQKDDKE